METETDRLLDRLRVLDAALAHLRADGDRSDVKQAIESLRVTHISKLRDLGHDYDGDGSH